MAPTIRLIFHPLETVFLDNNGITVNCTIHESQLTYNGILYDTVEYAFNYAENIGEGCFFCCPKSTCCGYHVGDREKVILLMHNNVIEHVYFKAHHAGQGMWLPWNLCNKDSDGNLIAYVARGSHAFYPNHETYIRIFGFANDQCSSNGLSLLSNITGTHNGEYIPKQHSITPIQRFFLPFVICCISNGPDVN